MVLTNGYLNDVLDDLLANIVSEFTYVGYGTGTAAASASDTALGSQISRSARQTYSETALSVTISGFLSSSTANGNTISEFGTFDAITAGQMKQRNVLTTPVVKTSDKELWVDFTTNVEVTQ